MDTGKLALLLTRLAQIPIFFIRGLFFRHALRLEKRMATELLIGLDSTYREIKRLFETTEESDPVEDRLRRQASGLHQLMDPDHIFSYSILIPLQSQNLTFLETSITSALNQTAPLFEVIAGGAIGDFGEDFNATVRRLQALAKEKKISLSFHVTPPDVVGEAATYNFLASQANHRFLFLFNGADRIRPDLLFRYEQTLRLNEEPRAAGRQVLYSNEVQIDEKGNPLPKTELIKPAKPDFPYYFRNWLGRGLLISRAEWAKASGLRSDLKADALFDLVLRLDLAGLDFKNLPFAIYFRRSGIESDRAGEFSSTAFLKEYYLKKGLKWKSEALPHLKQFRALPELDSVPRVHVVILYKERKELTLKAAQSALASRGVTVHVTAVDNGSQDRSIGEELAKIGVEVCRLEEPFNFSRLNNSALKKSNCSFENVLFLNNDAEVAPECLIEMSRWLAQEKVGMVGCKLYFPDGSLQHGGVNLLPGRKAEEMSWEHIEITRRDQDLFAANTTRTVEAVTAACSMVRRDVFLSLGGFDEVFYPIAFSDTDLCARFRKAGYLILYTPFATGVHHESMSRGKHMIEDFEASAWLSEQRVGAVEVAKKRTLKLQ